MPSAFVSRQVWLATVSSCCAHSARGQQRRCRRATDQSTFSIEQTGSDGKLRKPLLPGPPAPRKAAAREEGNRCNNAEHFIFCTFSTTNACTAFCSNAFAKGAPSLILTPWLARPRLASSSFAAVDGSRSKASAIVEQPRSSAMSFAAADHDAKKAAHLLSEAYWAPMPPNRAGRPRTSSLTWSSGRSARPAQQDINF